MVGFFKKLFKSYLWLCNVEKLGLIAYCNLFEVFKNFYILFNNIYIFLHISVCKVCKEEKEHNMDNNHESYGIISFGKTNGGSRNLFGSSITHSETIRLNVKRCILERNNNSDHYYPVNGKKGDLIELESIRPSNQFYKFYRCSCDYSFCFRSSSRNYTSMF